MKTHTPPAARAAWAKQLVEDSAAPDDILSSWERENFFAGATVQLRIPLRDPTEVCRHLALAEATFRELREQIEKTPRGPRMDLLSVHSVVRALNAKLNAFRAPRR